MLCLEAAFMSKQMVTGYANLFSYTSALLMTICSGPFKPNLGALKQNNFLEFVESLKMPCPNEIYLDFQILPQAIFENLNEVSMLTRQLQPDFVKSKHEWLDMMVTFSIFFILNPQLSNPHIKAELV